tara:strand:- start:2696 stop:2920 length:225 start_codon:yes stop_codon:yes gene_type:complete
VFLIFITPSYTEHEHILTTILSETAEKSSVPITLTVVKRTKKIDKIIIFFMQIPLHLGSPETKNIKKYRKRKEI